jgi:hypothetical protein
MRPPANRKEDHMLKKIIIASALGLGFFSSFQIGIAGQGTKTRVTASAGIGSPAGACGPCEDELCCNENRHCCQRWPQ